MCSSSADASVPALSTDRAACTTVDAVAFTSAPRMPLCR